jgi:hypothetical protein
VYCYVRDSITRNRRIDARIDVGPARARPAGGIGPAAGRNAPALVVLCAA